MIHIGERPRRVALRAFALVMGVWVGAVVALSTGVAGVEPKVWLLLGVGFGGVAAAVGWSRPVAVESVFRGWNRLVRLYARAAGLWLSALAFLVVAAAGRAGSRLRLGPRGPESGWMPHRTLAADGYESQGRHGDGPDVARSGWLASLAAWGPRSGNTWTLALIPFLLTLRWVRSRGRRSLGSDIYTLY